MQSKSIQNKISTCKRYGRPVDDIARFWSYVDIKGLFDCWEWNGSFRRGYGQFKANQQGILAHRFSYLLYHSEIPDGKQVNHRCHNSKCCNPFHLYAGTPKENTDDMMRAGRQVAPIGSRNGMAKLTEQQVVEIKENNNKLLGKELASQYNVSKATISEIRHEKMWKHVS